MMSRAEHNEIINVVGATIYDRDNMVCLLRHIARTTHGAGCTINT
jgi:hypothetical protein